MPGFSNFSKPLNTITSTLDWVGKNPIKVGAATALLAGTAGARNSEGAGGPGHRKRGFAVGASTDIAIGVAGHFAIKSLNKYL